MREDVDDRGIQAGFGRAVPLRPRRMSPEVDGRLGHPTPAVGRQGGDRVRPVDPDRGVYGISVAAEFVVKGVQTLRQYEVRGLLEPARTPGGTRRYSPNDLDRLRRIASLLSAGLNLAGIVMVLDLEQRNLDLTKENSRLRRKRQE
jgi:hypothetical protein